MTARITRARTPAASARRMPQDAQGERDAASSPRTPLAWMRERGWSPFAFQRTVWRAIAEGRSGLLHATTGAGKTYAVWLGALAHPRGRGRAVQDAAPPLQVLWLTARLSTRPIERAEYVEDLDVADRALQAIEAGLGASERGPFLFRKTKGQRSALRREMVVPFGACSYVVKYEIASPQLVVVLAVRHQHEADYR